MRTVLLGLLAAVGAEPAFIRAERAFMQHDLAGAEEGYRDVLATDTVVRHRIQAAVTLASLAWRVRHDTVAALGWLRQAPEPRGRYAALRERALMRLSFDNVAGARGAADSAVGAATTPVEREEAIAVAARTVVEPALMARLSPAPARGDDPALLRATTDRLLALVRNAPGALEPARLLMTGGILTEKGSAVLAGWKSYYLVATGDAATGALAAARATLESRLPELELARGTLEARLALVRALADSRLFPLAAALALAPASDGQLPADSDPRAREIVAYARFLADVERITDDYYRRTLLGDARAVEWRSALVYRGARLWPRLVWPGRVPAYTPAVLAAELDRRFGAVVNLGQTAGYEDLHYGHRVVDERRTVTQYGREATVRFVALDGLVSNGFQSWAWNGRAGHGGWATAETIVQVRPLYAEAPRKAWGDLQDPGARREAALRIEADSVADLARARLTPVAYFPGVAARLERNGRRRLLDSLAGAGLSGAALEAAFAREFGRVVVEISIFAHEGRHAIDAADSTLTAEEREYRAKLSQVVFAPIAELALNGIVDATVGDATPHGQANRRVLEGVLGWMQAHTADIAGLDPHAPLLPQLPLLTDQQLRAAFRSLDPLAR